MDTETRFGGCVHHVADCGAFGWILLPDGETLFLHRKAITNADTLKPGDQVTFQIIETPRGLKAVDVELIGGDADRVQADPEDPPPDRPPGSGW